MSHRKSAQEQRSSNIFGPPDSKAGEKLQRQKDAYRQELEEQMYHNENYRRETSRSNKDHPLESKVERYTMTLKRNAKQNEDEPDGEFVIGHEGKTVSDLQREKVEYQEKLTDDLQRKKDYLEHKEENDIKNRKPVVRSNSPILDDQFVIGAESIENERARRENAISFAQGNMPPRGKDKRLGEEDHSGFYVGTDAATQLSKKDRKKLQYKKELDEQMTLFELKKEEEQNRIQAEDRHNAKQNLPYSGKADAEEKRKKQIDERQNFLRRASQNYNGEKQREYSLDSTATFAIGRENENHSYLAQKQADYKQALDMQMDQYNRRVNEEKESIRRQDARYAEQNLPYLGHHDDE
mmetsp:Transcript_22106/g.37433  ORF Transcript_22106/g.37433 Transcript_22106/m.37433 type:complete len:352 (-) Transcript_22106:274-1329(-)